MCAILFNKNQLQPKSQLRFKSGDKIQWLKLCVTGSELKRWKINQTLKTGQVRSRSMSQCFLTRRQRKEKQKRRFKKFKIEKRFYLSGRIIPGRTGIIIGRGGRIMWGGPGIICMWPPIGGRMPGRKAGCRLHHHAFTERTQPCSGQLTCEMFELKSPYFHVGQPSRNRHLCNLWFSSPASDHVIAEPLVETLFRRFVSRQEEFSRRCTGKGLLVLAKGRISAQWSPPSERKWNVPHLF